MKNREFNLEGQPLLGKVKTIILPKAWEGESSSYTVISQWGE
jgi:hypothetical protein